MMLITLESRRTWYGRPFLYHLQYTTDRHWDRQTDRQTDSITHVTRMTTPLFHVQTHYY